MHVRMSDDRLDVRDVRDDDDEDDDVAPRTDRRLSRALSRALSGGSDTAKTKLEMNSDHNHAVLAAMLARVPRVGEKQRARNKQTQRAKTQSYSCEV
jgi:hypothetical protein